MIAYDLHGKHITLYIKNLILIIIEPEDVIFVSEEALFKMSLYVVSIYSQVAKR